MKTDKYKNYMKKIKKYFCNIFLLTNKCDNTYL